MQTIEKVKEREPDPPSGINRRVDRDLETICLKCLEKDPERRYASALALAEDLERWLRGEPTAARPLSGPARLRRWAWRRRRRLAVGAAALLMLVLIGLGAGQSMRLRQAGQLVREQLRVIRGHHEEARHAQYASDIRRASALIAHGEAKVARELLDRRVPGTGAEDFRGFEWFYLRGLIDTWRKSWVGHEGKEVYHVEYAPDCRTFATAGQDRTARIWDAATGQERLVLRGHEDEVNWVSFDPSGTRLVTAGDDGTVRVWDASDGGVLAVLKPGSGPVVATLFTRDSRDIIAATRDGLLVRWDVASGRRRAEIRQQVSEGVVESLAVSAEGTKLALAVRIGIGGSVGLHDLSLGGLTMTRRIGRSTAPFCVAFAPNGHALAATGAYTAHAFLFDPATGKFQFALDGPETTSFTLAFAPDGRTLAVGDHHGALRIWDLATRSCQVSLLGHADRIWCVAFAPDGRALATTSRDGTIRIWDATGRADRVAFRGLADSGCGASSVAFSADGTQLLAANEIGGVLTCNLSDGTSRTLGKDPGSSMWAARLAPDGSAVAVTETTGPAPAKTEGQRWTTVVYDLSGSPGRIKLPPNLFRTGETLPPLWSPDSKRLALIDPAGDLTLWDRITGRLVDRVAFGFGAGSSDAAFLPGGDVVIACCGDGDATPRRPYQLVVWNPARPQLDRRPMPIQDDRPGGKIVLARGGRNMADIGGGWPGPGLWDLRTLRRRFRLVCHSDRVTDLAFAPDGRTLATASLDRTVRLWSVATGQEMLVLEGHTGPVRVLAFSPDGSMLASCGGCPGGGIEAIVWRAVGWDGANRPPMRPPFAKEE